MRSVVTNNSQSGFTLIETLAAMALMGLIISVLVAITSQWLPNWNRGLDRIQRSELVSVALDRISADIAASEFIRPNGQTKTVLFDGSERSITLTRAALGPNAGGGLDLIRVAESGDRGGVTLTRTRAAFAPEAAAPNFVDPVVLLRTPYRVSFSYAGADRMWKPSWRDAETLPSAVLLTLQDSVTGRTLPISRIAVIHVSAPADSVCSPADNNCAAAPSPPVDGAIRRASSEASGQ
ncbi:MAG: type II secretion system protein [Bradyrhizobium sp.]|nr:type II secretion system protein [Bradyrhizobium sp.]MBV9985784.1 type II secretion system protein [Bradyrhizobium sp.]